MARNLRGQRVCHSVMQTPDTVVCVVVYEVYVYHPKPLRLPPPFHRAVQFLITYPLALVFIFN